MNEQPSPSFFGVHLPGATIAEISAREPAGKIQGHIAALDGVRGLAVLMVFAYHYGGGAKSSNPLMHAMGVLFQFGWSGVSLFFVLSGFLITGILWQGRHHAHWWKRFYIRRCLRIFPLYYFALALVFISVAVAHTLHIAWKPLLVYLLYLQNVPGMPNGVGAATRLTVFHFWSLAVEEQFYLFWPLLLVRMPNLRWARGLCVTVYALSWVFRLTTIHSGMMEFTPARVGELAVGAWLALAVRDHPDWVPRLRRAAVPAVVVGLAVPLLCGRYAGNLALSEPMYALGLALLPFACAGLLVLAMEGARVARVLSTPVLRHLGTVSYGIYVYHLLLAWPIWRITEHLAAGRTPVLYYLVRLVVAAVVTMAAAELSFRALEQPIMRLKDRLAPSTPPVRTIPTALRS